MAIKIFQVDAFTSEIFAGNPAAVCPLDSWLPEKQMQSIAMENNLSETAFFVQSGKEFKLRWFTPVSEVKLCGHATLASAHVLFCHLGYQKEKIVFSTKSGILKVKKFGSAYKMDFPVIRQKANKAPDELIRALGQKPDEVYGADDYLVVFKNEAIVAGLKPDYSVLKKIPKRGVIVTAKGESCDFVSRFFVPKLGINEDPVTGSAHCQLTPFWAERLGKTKLFARQISKRGGSIACEMKGERVFLDGRAITFLQGDIYLKP